MSSLRPKIGMVIPIYQYNFIDDCVSSILNSNLREDFILCIVNDGKEDVKEYLSNKEYGAHVTILNLPENCGFGIANNSGWKYLIDKYPSIKYLGSINDDTIAYKHWLDFLVESLEESPDNYLAMPTMEVKDSSFFYKYFKKSRRLYSTWSLKGASSMAPLKSIITKDTFVSAVNGFCFLVRKEELIKVGFLDESFLNGCEDLDLGIKLLLQKGRLVVSSRSKVFHIGGASRYLEGVKTNLDKNHELLAKKYDSNVEKFNNLNKEGFYSG